MVAAQGNSGEYVFFVAWNYDADWDLAVIGAVCGVESAATLVEADFSTQMAPEGGFKGGGVELRGTGRRWSNGLRHKAQNIFEDASAGCKG